MALTEGYITLPEAAIWLASQGYVTGRATLRAGCLAYVQGLTDSLPCEKIGTSRAASYYVRPDDALAFAQRKHQTTGKRGRGRPMGTVGIPRGPKKSATPE